MIRTASPCCQSAGEKNSPHASPASVSASAAPLSQGCSRAASRRNRPGLANRCRLAREEGADATMGEEAGVTPQLYRTPRTV